MLRAFICNAVYVNKIVIPSSKKPHSYPYAQVTRGLNTGKAIPWVICQYMVHQKFNTVDYCKQKLW